MNEIAVIHADTHLAWVTLAVILSGLGARLFAHAVMHIETRAHWLPMLSWALIAACMIGVSTWLAHSLVLSTLSLPWSQGLLLSSSLQNIGLNAVLSLLAVGMARLSGFSGKRALIFAGVSSVIWVTSLTGSVASLGTLPTNWDNWLDQSTFVIWAFIPAILGSTGATAIFAYRFNNPRLRQLKPWLGALAYMLGCFLAYILSLKALSFSAESVSKQNELIGFSHIIERTALVLIILIVGVIFIWVDRNERRNLRRAESSIKEMKDHIRRQAYTDTLTFMPNRLQMEETLSKAQTRVGRQPGALAILFIDIDGFKPINDTYGHVDGDTVLREVGRRLATLCTPQQMVARIGGDEFLMMMEEPNATSVVAQMAARINALLRDPYLLPNNIAVNLTSSIGIALFPDHCTTDRLISHADAAKFAAKRLGGNTYVFYDHSMNLADEVMMALQSELRVAVERNELMLHYQPKIDAQTGKIRGVEALVRWTSPTRGMVSPAKFIPVAERFGIIMDLGNWVINEACRQTREWMNQDMRLKVAINLSVFQLRMDTLVPFIEAAMKRFDIEPSLLIFEVTESAAMEDPKATRGKLKAIKKLGVSLSIDDFGTGYSSLSYLRQLPFQQLKIDRSFVIELDRDTRDDVSTFEENQKQNSDALAIVDAIVRLSHALNYRVVAEGVETYRQRDILLNLGIDEFQGYLFAKPMSASMLALWALGDEGNIIDDFPATQAFVPSGFFDSTSHHGIESKL